MDEGTKKQDGSAAGEVGEVLRFILRGAAIVAVVIAAIVLIMYLYWRSEHADAFAAGEHSDAFAAGEHSGAFAAGEHSIRQGGWKGWRGPYNLQLYDSPRYYPFYESRDYAAAWDTDGRCATYCRASDDGGCAVVCR